MGIVGAPNVSSTTEVSASSGGKASPAVLDKRSHFPPCVRGDSAAHGDGVVVTPSDGDS